MLVKSKYWKATLGTFADVLLAKQVDYAGTGSSAVTNTSDFKDFVANAVEGEFGFFNADTNALISGATSGSPAAVTPVSTSTYIYGAVKRDGAIEKTLKFRLSDYTAKRVAYAAAVAQASKASFSGTPVAGKFYSVKVIETTPGFQPFPRWEYGYTAKSGDSLSTVLTAIVALINDKTNVINKDTDSIITASLSSSTITFTATSTYVTFKLAFSADALNDIAPTPAYTGSGTAVQFVGSGTYDLVKELEKESDVYKGLTTQYTPAGTRPDEFGQPTAFATAGVQYSTYILTGTKGEASPTPVDRHFQPHTIILAIPSNGSANTEAEVKGILGL